MDAESLYKNAAEKQESKDVTSQTKQEATSKKGSVSEKSSEKKDPTEATRKELESKDKELLSKDKEIERLKKNLQEAKDVNKTRTDDIRSRTNRNGDIAKVCIGTNSNGQRIWKEANRLTDADIERRNNYLEGIKQHNAKKY